jgi:Endonuclease/Exonuclease/phosphatase family.
MTESEEANINQKSIRIVTWNCRQGSSVFFNKLKKIMNWKRSPKIDVYIIQECPKLDNEILNKFDLQCAGWAGRLDNEAGVGIFVRKGLAFQ